MNMITINAEGISNVTIVPNAFIDQYMSSANGAYVKVYLYLLRCFSGSHQGISISSIADHLDNTEKDVIRALSYWEKLRLLTITRNSLEDITTISLIDFSNLQNHVQAPYQDYAQDEIAVSEIPDESVPSFEIINANDAVAPKGAVFAKDTSLTEEPIESIPLGKKPTDRQSYSAEKTAQLTNNDDVKWMIHIVEIYLDRPLKPMDIQLILYLYEELHFSAELIMYLYEYCVSKSKKNVSYIEAVALTWAEEGIDTEEKAKVATAAYSNNFNVVNKAFGLNRAPGQIERQYITKWVETFGFSDDIITEACNRTILRTQKPDFKYADKILDNWFKKGVKDKADILLLDEEFSKASTPQSTGKKTMPAAKPSTNKFNQFPQRTYTAQDYAELERKLLHKGS